MGRTMMRTVVAEDFSLDALKLSERPVPQPGRGEILVRVRAASLNYRDLAVLSGGYLRDLKLPFVPVSDACGFVAGLGEGVSRFSEGDRVVPCYIQGWHSGDLTAEQRFGRTLGGPLPGVLQDYVVVPAEDAVSAPPHLSDAEAATLPIAGLTAWSCLMAGGIKAGCTVLVQGTGGVALYALQLAKISGARVIALTSTQEKADLLSSMGADEVLNYRQTPAWGGTVKELTGGSGADIIVETAGSSLGQSLTAVSFGGFIGVIGFVGGYETPLNIRQLIGPGVRMQGIIVGHRQGLQELCRALEVNDVHPVVDREFDMAEAPTAFRHLEAGAHVGKIVIRV